MKWPILVVLAAAQFLMVLDQAVMNVAISQLVEDFDTTVTTIQAVIAFYALVMAGLMLTGGKLGDIWGRRRAFTIGICIYAVGSGLTAASWSVPSLMFGWSILEGIGAALVIPALIALVAGNYKGNDRAIAYGVLGGVAGAGCERHFNLDRHEGVGIAGVAHLQGDAAGEVLRDRIGVGGIVEVVERDRPVQEGTSGDI